MGATGVVSVVAMLAKLVVEVIVIFSVSFGLSTTWGVLLATVSTNSGKSTTASSSSS